MRGRGRRRQEERRDRGLALAEMGLVQAAVIDIQAYLDARDDAADAPALRMRLRDFERRGGAGS